MLIDTTYDSRDNDALINETLGKSFSFFQSIKMGGIGSKRMIISEVSPGLQEFLNTVSDTNYSSIEMRPLGIIVYFVKGRKNFSWLIPYDRLTVSLVDGVRIYSDNQFIEYLEDKSLEENAVFFKKVLDAQSKHQGKDPDSLV